MDRKKLLIEGIVIVLSILLAFAIDAWWQERKERIEEREILAALKFEFEANAAAIEQVIAFHVRSREAVDAMVHRTEAEIRALEPISHSEFILGLCNTWTFDAILGTTDTLISAGKLDVLENHELRIALTTFVNLIQDAIEDAEFMAHDAERVWVAEIEAGGPWANPETEVGLKGDAVEVPEFVKAATADDVLRVLADRNLMGLVARCHINVGYYLNEVHSMRDQAAVVLEMIEESSR